MSIGRSVFLGVPIILSTIKYKYFTRNMVGIDANQYRNSIPHHRAGNSD